MKLKPKELCPIHRRRDCCGRAEFNRYPQKRHSKWEQVSPGIRRIADANSDFGDGWRYKYSAAVTKRVLAKRIEMQAGNCALCGLPMEDINDVDPDHRLPRGMNGGRRDDRLIQAAHRKCNLEKGSKRT